MGTSQFHINQVCYRSVLVLISESKFNMMIPLYQNLMLFSLFLVPTYAFEDLWNFGYARLHRHLVPIVPPQKSVCDKMISWLDMLGHNNSYSCPLLPTNTHAIIPEYCSIAGVETFNHCNQVGKEQAQVEECLEESLQEVEGTSNLFNRCLCHGYIENYAGMLAIWMMMCDDFPYESYDDLLSYIATEKDDRDARDSYDALTHDNELILRGLNLYDRVFVIDDSVRPTSHWIRRHCGLFNWGSCSEEYLLVDYYIEGYPSVIPYKVYVAKKVGKPPSKFITSGYKGKLHFGFLYFAHNDEARAAMHGGSAVYFVLHPNSWGPYQNNFQTPPMIQLIADGIEKAESEAKSLRLTPEVITLLMAGLGGAYADAVIGSVIPKQVWKELDTALSNHGVKSFSKDANNGNYLRYIG